MPSRKKTNRVKSKSRKRSNKRYKNRRGGKWPWQKDPPVVIGSPRLTPIGQQHMNAMFRRAEANATMASGMDMMRWAAQRGIYDPAKYADTQRIYQKFQDDQKKLQLLRFYGDAHTDIMKLSPEERLKYFPHQMAIMRIN